MIEKSKYIHSEETKIKIGLANKGTIENSIL